MGSDQIVALLRHTIETALWMGAPLLIAAVVVGLLINVVQVLTSLQDMTVSTVPRLAAVAAAVLLGFVFTLLQTLTSLQEQSLTTVPRLAAVAIILLVGMPWFLGRLAAYTRLLLTDFQRYIG